MRRNLDEIKMEDKLTKINEMIGKENDPEKRSVLLVLHCLTSNLNVMTKILTEMSERYESEIKLNTSKLERHSKLVLQGRTLAKVAVIMLSFLQVIMIGVGGYGYRTLVDLHDSTLRHDLALINIETRLEIMNENHKALEEQERAARMPRVVLRKL